MALKRGVDAGGSTLAGQARKFVWVGSLSQLPRWGTGLDISIKEPMMMQLLVHAACQLEFLSQLHPILLWVMAGATRPMSLPGVAASTIDTIRLIEASWL